MTWKGLNSKSQNDNILFYFTDHIEGREHFKKILGGRKNTAVVSLGDLGESKPVVEGSSEVITLSSFIVLHSLRVISPPFVLLALRWYNRLL